MSEDPTTLDRFMQGEARSGNRAQVMALVGLAGFVGLIWVAAGALAAPWQLDPSSPTVMSSSAECNARLGAQYEIRVDGQSYGGCGGATNKCGEVEAIAIAYDTEDPSLCRVATAVDGLGRYEATVMMLGLGLSFAGLAGLSFLLSLRARRAALAGDTNADTAKARFQLLQRISWAALAAAVLMANGTALYALL